MTRETKVGLIVAGSFLCLVCVVVASKLHRGDDPGKGASEEQTAPGAVAAVSAKASVPAPKVTTKNKGPKGDGLRQASVEKKDGEKKSPLVKAGEPHVPTTPIVNPDGTPTAFPPLVKIEGAPLEIPPVVKPEGTPVPTPPAAKPDAGTLTFPPIVKPEGAPATAPSAIKPDAGTLTFPPIVKPEGTPVTAPPTVKPKGPSIELPPFVKPEGAPATPPAVNPAAGTLALPTLPKEAAVPIVPPLGQPTPLPGTQVKPAPSITNTEPIKPGSAIMPPNPIPTIPPSIDLPNTAKPEQFIKMKNPNAKPMPIIRDSELYVCQPGDTNFAALSLKFYKTDKYAQALLHYNRDNYKATVNGAVFLNDAPVLVPGQQINVAPVNILDRDYLAVRPVSTAPVPTIPSTAPPLSKPLPLNPIQGTNRLPPSGARTYTVQNPGGESILDIAERVLGDRGQWHKIWRVNPSYPPQVRIPAGAKLEIPAN